MKKLLYSLLFLISFFIVDGQTWSPQPTTINNNCGGYYEYIPIGYDGIKKFPLILFLHGIGELGDGKTQLSIINNTGLPQLIKNGGFPSTFNVNNQTYSFIVVAPQFKSWPTSNDVSSVMNYALSKYSIDTTRIYVTGLSMGGGNTWDYASSSSQISKKLAAILPICGASYPNVSSQTQNIASANLPVLATHNNDDGTVSVNNTIAWVDGINSYNPNPNAIKIIWPSGGHDAWTRTYNPSNKLYNNLNAYEWMLQYKRNEVPTYIEVKNANDQSTFVPYNGIYGYGSNMGYFGNHFNDKDVSQLIYNAGARTSRPSLPDWLITDYGVNSRVSEFQFYEQLGLKDLTAFLGEPSQKNRETFTFPNCTEPAKTFKGMYEPIWLDANKTQPNPANTYANYIYQTVKTYGKWVKFWEIVNEPDFTYGDGGWNNSSPNSWYKVNPKPEELTNLQAPIQYYVRMLRVAWEVIKTIEPTDYVCTGGLGYSAFLDALLRNTDNPVDGSVTPQYPYKAGAYFDVLSFHDYPQYGLSYWDNSIGARVYTRHSDAAADFHVHSKNEMDSILKKYNYGVNLPSKQWICTETDLGSKDFPNDGWGSPEAAKNYIIKQNIFSQLNDIKQTYKWAVSKKSNPTYSFESMGLYYDLDNPTATIANAKPVPEFYELKTISQLLYGSVIDKSKTLELKLPASVRGAAFKKPDGKYVYVLWAKTTNDLSEIANATYTFPFNFNGTKKMGDFTKTGISETINTSTVQLTAYPSIFEEVPLIINQPPTANAGTDIQITLPANSVTLSGIANDPEGKIKETKWTYVSGPANYTIVSPTSLTTIINNLSVGEYVFKLTVTDDAGLSVSDEIKITVIELVPVFDINLFNFYGVPKSTTNEIYWVTTKEYGGDYFILERSIDGNIFYEINKINIKNNLIGSTYSFEYILIDKKISYYYILKMVGIDKKQVNSGKILIQRKNKKDLNNASIYPNPANNTITIDYDESEKINSIVIRNQLGVSLKLYSSVTSIPFTININELRNGLYYITFNGYITKKFIKL